MKFQNIINALEIEAKKDPFEMDMQKIVDLLRELGEEAYNKYNYKNPNNPKEIPNPLERFFENSENNSITINHFSESSHLSIAINQVLKAINSAVSEEQDESKDVLYVTQTLEMHQFGGAILERLINRTDITDDIILDQNKIDQMNMQLYPYFAKLLNRTYDLSRDNTEKQQKILLELCKKYQQELAQQLPNELLSDEKSFDPVLGEKYTNLLGEYKQFEFFIQTLQTDPNMIAHPHKLNIVLGAIDKQEEEAEKNFAGKVSHFSGIGNDHSSYYYSHHITERSTFSPNPANRPLTFAQILKNLRKIISDFLFNTPEPQPQMSNIEKFRNEVKDKLAEPDDFTLKEGVS